MKLGNDKLRVFTGGTKDEKGEVGAGVVIPHWNVAKEFKITNDTAVCRGEQICHFKGIGDGSRPPPPSFM